MSQGIDLLFQVRGRGGLGTNQGISVGIISFQFSLISGERNLSFLLDTWTAGGQTLKFFRRVSVWVTHLEVQMSCILLILTTLNAEHGGSNPSLGRAAFSGYFKKYKSPDSDLKP